MSASAKSRMVYPSGTDSPGYSRSKGHKMVVVVVVVVVKYNIIPLTQMSLLGSNLFLGGNVPFDSGFLKICPVS